MADAVAAAQTWLARPDALPEPELTVLGIADLNPANVLWDGRTCRLVDFEDGGLSDPAYELADHTEHLAGSHDGARRRWLRRLRSNRLETTATTVQHDRP